MNKILPFLFGLFLLSLHSAGQSINEKIIYVVDSVLVIDDPEEGDDILQTDIAEVIVLKNKDSLKLLGLDKFDGAIYIFTKEYQKRTEEIKRIPSTKQMERRNGAYSFRGMIYSGKFIDYYYSGRKQGEGTFQNGKLEGIRTMYYQNGKIAMERYYSNGIENGMEKEYYTDGSLKQKGEFVNGNEEGIWDMYFPNGQVKQRSTFKDGKMEGETTVYYSSGKILAIEVTRGGKTTPDKRLEKINKLMTKSSESNKEGDTKAAVKYCSNVIELDSTYAAAYFSRGTIKLNEFQFEEAIADFDKALKFEPFMEIALSNRAFARIRKYQFGSSRVLSKNDEVTVLASKDKVPIPLDEQERICSDLHNAVFLGNKSKMIAEALTDYCQTNVTNKN